MFIGRQILPIQILIQKVFAYGLHLIHVASLGRSTDILKVDQLFRI